MNSELLSSLHNKTVNLVLEVGQFIYDAAKNYESINIEEKSHNSLVSYVDKKAEEMLIEGCLELTPNATFIAEESNKTDSNTTSELVWIIDPLDGTTNFLHGLPHYSISIALKHFNETILGVVYHVPNNEVFSSYKGQPLFINSIPFKLNNTSDLTLENALIATGFPYYNYEATKPLLAFLEEMMLKTRGIRRFGSAALDLAYTACGRYQAFYEHALNSWDVAAGIFLVQQAGGTVSDFNNGLNYHSGQTILACNPSIHSALISLLKKHSLHHFALHQN